MSKVLLIDAHPFVGSFGTALSASYGEGAAAGGHEVRTLVLRDLEFDPLLRQPSTSPTPEEPALQHAQESILWAEHLVVQYPTWWGGGPALLKGFVDRTLLSGFAYKYHDGGKSWDKLLQGRSARLMVTMDAPGWWDRFANGRSSRRWLKDGTLKFSGIRPVRVSLFSSVHGSTPARRESWIAQTRALGENAT